jgi:enoyl-CoA hydratase
MNALSSALRRRFGEALAALGADDAVRAVVITGAGEKAFTAGVDLKELETAPLTAGELGPDSEINRAFRALGKPAVAAVNGFAITGGLEIAINCDILVASTNARFADTHARVGIVPGWGMSQLLPRLIGPVRARYMSYTGNFVDAATAKDWGLVLDVLPPGELLPYCRKLAADIASCDHATLADIRLAINGGLGGTLEDGLALEGRLSKAATQRMDREGFAATRATVMSRGKEQSH